MKRMSNALNSSVKKVRYCDETSNCEDENSIPPHYFHLGGDNFVVVSDFSGVVRVHIRKFIKNQYGRYIPTKVGITLSPVLWQGLSDKLDMYYLPRRNGESIIIEESLMLSTVEIKDQDYITIQQYIQRKDFLRVFLPTMCFLSEEEWVKLKEICNNISDDAIEIMFGKFFPNILLKEVAKKKPSEQVFEIEPSDPTEKSDIEMILTTSLTELLKEHIEHHIQKLLKCSGCITMCDNQLGHECIGWNYKQLFEQYGKKSLFCINLEQLSDEFIEKNLNIVNHITVDFINHLDMQNLIQSSVELHIKSDPNPLRLVF